MSAEPIILVVDDTPENLALVNMLLKGRYETRLARNGELALRLAGREPLPDLILLDVMMPGMDGYEVCRRLKEDELTRDIPVIFLTAMSRMEDEKKGLELGAVDYITKPLSPAILLARISTHLKLKQAGEFLKHQNRLLEEKVQARTRQISALQDATIVAMASLAETRDNETGQHILRTQQYVKLLADHLRDHPRFREFLTEEVIQILFKSAPLHDIGKVGIPDHILLKPGKLTPEEFEIMKMHTVYGRDALLAAESLLGREHSFLHYARQIAYSHHEKWDGSGYPLGIKRNAIPVAARLMAVADVYDALISRRVYKPPFEHTKAVEIIMEGRETHFDPDIIDVFGRISDSFRKIVGAYPDGRV